jgi:hypothetical protein
VNRWFVAGFYNPRSLLRTGRDTPQPPICESRVRADLHDLDGDVVSEHRFGEARADELVSAEFITASRSELSTAVSYLTTTSLLGVGGVGIAGCPVAIESTEMGMEHLISAVLGELHFDAQGVQAEDVRANLDELACQCGAGLG